MPIEKASKNPRDTDPPHRGFSEAGLMKVERVSAEPGFALGVIGSLAISVWESGAEVHHARAAVRLLQRLGRDFDGIQLLAVLGPGCVMPDERVRQELAKGLVSVGPRILSVANVIEGQGFRGAALRGVLTGLSIVVRHQYPQEVFSNVSKASVFLERESRPALTASEVTRAVARLRSETGWGIE